MTSDQVREAAIRILGAIAPEADPAQIQPDVSLRRQLDLDSMDYLNFVIALHEELKIEIPESDYPRLDTLNGCVKYCTSSTQSV